ncbi:MAG: choice-of-anchor Q domain-containing protein [Verrucomicrobiota bacterium]
MKILTLVLAGCLLLPALAPALIFNVTNTNDAGAGSLRAAVTAANAAPGPDQIGFLGVAGGTIFLNSQINITDSVNILGTVTGTITLDGGTTTRILGITEGASPLSVNISNLIFTNGSATSAAAIDAFGALSSLLLVECRFENNTATIASGGAIRAILNSFTANRCVFDNNQAPNSSGGAIQASGGSAMNDVVNIFNSEFINNSADSNGGAIDTSLTTEDVNIEKCNFTMNSSASTGGALFLTGGGLGDLDVRDTTFHMNSTDTEAGAMFYSGGAYDDLIIQGCTFSSNTAGTNGGAIRRTAAAVGQDIIRNCTFSGNSANEDGGAIQIVTGNTMDIDHCTFTQNTADADDNFTGNGGAIFAGGAANPTLSHNLFGGNADLSNAGGVHPDVSDSITTDGHNFVEDPTGSSGFNFAGTDETFASLGVASINEIISPTLADNGGSTPTHLLVFAGPGHNGGSTNPGTALDQRSFDRMVGPNRDIGAVELGVLPYLTWTADQGLAAQLAGFTLDPDEDVIPNGLEWKLGLNPLVADNDGTLVDLIVDNVLTGGGDTVEFSFQVTIAPDFPLSLCQAQFSDDLGLTDPWATAPFAPEVIQVLSDGSKVIKFKGDIAPNKRKLFGRLVAIQD